MPYYNIYFRYVDKNNLLRHGHTLHIPAKSKGEAKAIVIRGEKSKQIVVDRVVKV